jgi:predicted outer membrane repeat protein
VVTASVAYAAAVLDGFTITGGNASSLYYEDPNSRGGGLYGGYPVLLNCTLTANYARQGGGMCGWGIFVDCMFIANSADDGGAVYSGGDFTNCTFIGNSARIDGGAINGDGYLTGCTFRRNSAGYWGGAVYNCDTAVARLIDCVLEGNSADWAGGGVYVYQGEVELIDCLLRGNSANEGGAVASNNSYSRLIDCTFTGNSASQSGGGVWNWGSMIMTSCSITDNSAEQGGGISTNGELLLINSTLAGNWASQSGGGLWNRCGDLCLSNCTFAGNSADRGHALASNTWEQRCSTSIQLTNCILWDGGNEIWNNDYSAEITIAHSGVQGGPAAVYDPCNVVIWGDGNIDSDPCFADPGYWDPNGTPEDPNDDFWVDGDYHLKSQAGRWDANEGRWVRDEVTSPCIDVGDPMSPIGLEPFPNGGVVNMGAYGGTAEASKSYFGELPCESIVAGDINGDCAVDFKDFVLMALHWLGGG